MIPGLQVDAWSIARPLLLFIVIPLAAGMFVKSCAAAFAARAAPVLAMIGNAALLLFLVLLIALNLRALLGIVGSFVVVAAVLYFAGLFGIGWLLGAAKPEARGVLALATTARNFGAALAPAANSFRRSEGQRHDSCRGHRVPRGVVRGGALAGAALIRSISSMDQMDSMDVDGQKFLHPQCPQNPSSRSTVATGN